MQSDYYKNSVEYLGLIEEYFDKRGKKTFKLNNKGQRIMSGSLRNKYIYLIKSILSHQPFNDILNADFQKKLNNFESLSDNELGEIISKCFKGYA